MATQFRPLGPGDAEELALHLTAWQRQDGGPLDPALIRRAVGLILVDSPRRHVWLVQSGDDVVGYVVLSIHTGQSFEAPSTALAALYLRPGRRNSSSGLAARRFMQDLGGWLQVRVTMLEPARDRPHPATVAPPSGLTAQADRDTVQIAA